MKNLSIGTATVAVAFSLASTAQAREAAPAIETDLDAILFADAVYNVAPAQDFDADSGKGYLTVYASAPLAPADVSLVGQVKLPFAIDEATQGAIYDVDLADAAGESTVTAPSEQSDESTLNVSNLSDLDAPFDIEAPAQDAIYDVDFLRDNPEGFLTLPKPAADSLDDRVVTARALVPNYGDIDAFYGDIVAFYGDIDAFWGDINPFYGDIGAFWGDISPFYGDIGAFWGDISPFYGDIGAFWGDIDAFYGDIGAFYGDIGAFEEHIAAVGQWGAQAKSQITKIEGYWSDLKHTTDASGALKLTFDGTPGNVRNSLQTLINQAEAQFGAAYTAKTGKSFQDGFVAEILARHGLNLENTGTAKTTLIKSEAERAAFFLDWHDSLMQYSGIDQVDHWMGAINWTPSITQIQGEGKQAIIGVIDGSFASDADLSSNVVWAGGGTTTVNGHGAGVASLIAGSHDGEGIMGIAPKVKIATYNPFDSNHKASWDSVANGIQSLLFKYVGGNDTGYVSIINLSLGESGSVLSQGMVDVFNRPTINAWSHETLYVVAAGNDGISQTTDLNWNFNKDTNLILVGSVDPNGQISNFSNRPGDACLLDNGVCHAGNELMNRFIVAPGSMLLVSDGLGGVTRASGTSFAAPLVSGAVSLLHDRWRWLVKHPEESAEIIFRSARDLGAPGVDEVYGWGMLDVAASQSPLDFGALDFKMYQKGLFGSVTSSLVNVSSLLAQGSLPSSWEANNAYLTAFENIGDTYRDFAIPLSSFQRGNSTDVLGHGSQRMQDFVADRFARWLLSNGADKDGDGQVGISQLRSNGAETSGQWNFQVDALAPTLMQDGALRSEHSAATLTSPGGNMSFTVGHGHGAMMLNGGRFGMVSDHDADIGGVNPVLGLASGEMFAGATYKPASATTVSVGFSAQNENWKDLRGASEVEVAAQRQLGDREAQAFTVAVEQKLTDKLSVGAQWTRLNEEDALLGEQTGSDAFLGNGSKTDAVTFSAQMDLGDGLSFDLSVTGGATKTDAGQLLATSGPALSTAGQFAVNKRGVMNSNDVLRFSIGQPLTVESGELELRSDQVIDRETGEIGTVSQFIGIETKRRVAGEIVYATPVADNAEFGLVGRYISEGNPGQEESVMIGANFGWKF